MRDRFFTEQPGRGEPVQKSSEPACILRFGLKNADFGAYRASLYTHKSAWIEFFNELGCSQRFARQPQI
jgi:hypothetical protein